MSALPLAVVLQLIASCAPTVAPSTMASVLRTESGFDPNELHVNGPNGGDIHPATKADAIVQAIDLIVVQRKSVDLGLGQVNSGNLASLGLSVADTLDPCKNLAAAAKILSAGYITAVQTQADPQRALRSALSRYNTGDPARGFANGYVGKVERSALYVVPAISVATAATETPTGQTAPVQPVQSQPLPPSWDAFGMAALHSASAFAPPGNSLPTPATPSVFPPSVTAAAPVAAAQSGAAVPWCCVLLRTSRAPFSVCRGRRPSGRKRLPKSGSALRRPARTARGCNCMNPTAIALSPPAWIAYRGQAGTAIAPGIARAFAQLRPSRTLRLLAFAGLMTLCFDHMAFAQTVTGGGTGSLTTFLTNVVNLLTGTLGQSIAVIAVAAVGIAWALGQASPRFALGTVVGVAILFSSAWIVGQISGNGGG